MNNFLNTKIVGQLILTFIFLTFSLVFFFDSFVLSVEKIDKVDSLCSATLLLLASKIVSDVTLQDITKLDSNN